MESGTKRCAKEKEGDRISKVRKLSSDIRSFFEQPTNASGECTSVLTHASIQPTDAAQLDSISTLQAVLSEPPNVLLDQMISDEEIDEDDVQVISSVDDQSACSIPFLANHTTPNSSKQIESTTIESVGHNSAEAGSMEDNVTDIGIAAKLQRRELDVYEAYQRIDDTIALIQQYRNEIEVFHDKVCDEAKELAEDIGSTEGKA
ncbi:hypothetical protein EMCRGX_G009662 [Ephydatia muelleri]